MQQTEIDRDNAAFWDELCGTGLAQSIGLRSDDPSELGRFDDTYFGFYPYLKGYVDRFDLRDAPVLEIGLGYGTLSQYIAERGADYHGLDIAEGPVRMVRHRMRMLGRDPEQVVQGSALEIPFPSSTFQAVYSIGCLHHTGDLVRSLEEVSRVIRPGGVAVIMLYNRHSFRQLVQVPLVRLKERRQNRDARVRAMYDANQAGEAAPHTDYVTRREVRRLLRTYASVKIEARNFDHVIHRGKVLIQRERLLGNVDRVLGLDLYIVARK